MPATRAKFSCGHRGFGGFCHRCAEAKKLEAKLTKAKGGEAELLQFRIARLKALPGQMFEPVVAETTE